jgi:hypothetical protein
MVNNGMKEYKKSTQSPASSGNPSSISLQTGVSAAAFHRQIQTCISEAKTRISNRLANRQAETIRIAPKPFRFSAEHDSNRLYFVDFWAWFSRPQNGGFLSA